MKIKPKYFNWLTAALLLLIFAIRVFQFSNIQFDSDFGRDSLFAWRIINEKPTLIGAQASVGGFYLGPLYFYVIAAVYSVFGPIPELMMLFFAILNVSAAWLGWFFLSKKVSNTAGFIFLLLFGTSATLVSASRGATHAPMLPFVTVLVTLLLQRALERKRTIDHFISGLSLGLFLHVHFSALLLFPGYFLVVFMLTKEKLVIRLKTIALHLLALIVMLSPLIFFDLRHGYITSRAFYDYVISVINGGAIRDSFPHWTITQKADAFLSTFSSNKFIIIMFLFGFAYGFWLELKKKSKTGVISIALLFTAVSLLFLYKGYLFSYYLIVPITLLLLVTSQFLARLKWVGIVVAIVLSTVGIGRLKTSYLPQFRTVRNLTYVVDVIEQNQNKQNNPEFAVFKDSGDGLTGLAYEYRFLLTRDGHIPVSEYAYEQASLLYIIREDGISDPLSLGNQEVKMFGPKKIISKDIIWADKREITIFTLSR